MKNDDPPPGFTARDRKGKRKVESEEFVSELKPPGLPAEDRVFKKEGEWSGNVTGPLVPESEESVGDTDNLTFLLTRRSSYADVALPPEWVLPPMPPVEMESILPVEMEETPPPAAVVVGPLLPRCRRMRQARKRVRSSFPAVAPIVPPVNPPLIIILSSDDEE